MFCGTLVSKADDFVTLIAKNFHCLFTISLLSLSPLYLFCLFLCFISSVSSSALSLMSLPLLYLSCLFLCFLYSISSLLSLFYLFLCFLSSISSSAFSVFFLFFDKPTGFVDMCVHHIPSPNQAAVVKVILQYSVDVK